MTITIPVGAKYARILGIGGVRGNRVVTNDEMCTIIDSSDEWIQQRTGIVERRWVDDEQTIFTMGVEAATKAIDRSGVDREDIDAVLISTVSYMKQTPSMATQIAHELGLGQPAAFDISAACAGFSYGIALADSLVRAGNATNVLVIGVEALSTVTNFEDRSTAFLFGDGAGAAVVGPSDTPAIGPVVWGSRGEDADVIYMDDWRDSDSPVIHMEGNKVFRWAISEVAEKCVEALEAAGLTPDELDAFIPHQANNRITDAMLRQLKLPDTVAVSRDIRYMGNSSAASVPIAMEAMLESGQAKSGDTALIIGFGAGLAYAGQVVVLP